MQIPLICTTTIEIPLILEIQRTRRVYLYEVEEQPDVAILYLPEFGKFSWRHLPIKYTDSKSG